MYRILPFLFIVLAYSQEYGLSLGATMHQYRTQVAQYPPTLGWTFKGVAKFDFSGNSKWKIMPEFGYFLSVGKTTLDSSQYLSVLTGQGIPYGVDVNIWTHFIDFRLLLKYHFDESEGFGFFLGGDVMTFLAQTLIATYEIPNGPDGYPQKVREWQKNPVDQVSKVIPRFVPNILLGGEVKMLPKSKHKWFLYGDIILQGDRFGLPSGAEFGVKTYFGANN